MKFKEIGDMLWRNSLEENYQAFKKKLGKIDPLTDFDSEHPCVFVLSTGRVGTQTLAALLGLSDKYSVYHEPSPKLYRLGKKYYELTNSEENEMLFREAFILARSQLFEKALKLGCGYIETSPQVTFMARVIHDLFPASKFIHLVRDPREVVRSGMRRNWFNNPEYDENRINLKSHSICQIDWGKATDLEKNIWLWTETNDWIMNFTRTINSDRHIRIHSTDLFNADVDAMNFLFQFIKRKAPSYNDITRVVMKKLNSQEKGDFPASEKWTADMNSSLQVIAGETIKALGFKSF